MELVVAAVDSHTLDSYTPAEAAVEGVAELAVADEPFEQGVVELLAVAAV